MRFWSSRGVLFALVVVWLSGGAAVSAAPDDHPLVARFEGSRLQRKKVDEAGKYMLVTDRSLKGDLVGRALAGTVTRIVYENPRGPSTREIFGAYQKSLVRAGMIEIYACEMAQCGPADKRGAWNSFNGLFTAAEGDPRYLAGTLVKGPATTYVAVMVGRAHTQVDIVEILTPEKSGAR